METIPPTPVADSPRSGLALASLICGICGLLTCGVSSLVGVILGHLALSDIKKTGKEGRGLAVGGLVTSYVLMVLVGVSALAGLTAPMILRQRKAAERVETISNTKQISLAMMVFDHEYGAFPSDEMAERVARETGTNLPMTGPDVLNQLEAAGATNQGIEKLLEVSPMTEGDWIYFPGLSSSDPGTRVLLVSPAIGDRRVGLRVDSSVEVLAPGEPLEGIESGIIIPAPRR